MLGVLCLLLLWNDGNVLYIAGRPVFQAPLWWSELAAPIDHSQTEYINLLHDLQRGPVQGMFSSVNKHHRDRQEPWAPLWVGWFLNSSHQ